MLDYATVRWKGEREREKKASTNKMPAGHVCASTACLKCEGIKKERERELDFDSLAECRVALKNALGNSDHQEREKMQRRNSRVKLL